MTRIVSVGGSDAAIAAMVNEAVGRHFLGANLDDPEVFLGEIEERAEKERDDCFVGSGHNPADEPQHHPSVFYQYYDIPSRLVGRTEVLLSNKGHSVARGAVAQGKHPQFYEGLRIH